MYVPSVCICVVYVCMYVCVVLYVYFMYVLYVSLSPLCE